MIGMAKPCRILHETTPFLRLGATQTCLLAAKSLLHATETIADTAFPLVAEQHHQRTGAQVRLLVPERLTAWQSESLARLNSPVVSLLPFKPRARGTNIRCQSLIAASSHRHQHATEAPFAAISPIHLKQLAKRLGSASNGGATPGLPRRVFVSRRGAKSRRISNESEISSCLEGHGFCAIQLEKLNLSEQIDLFHHATHFIAVHGAGLTNLMHATQSNILELFASEHGIRPDYFQIASIFHLHYYFHCLPSQN
jgi:capsular polysaccharide biosynthesis protein